MPSADVALVVAVKKIRMGTRIEKKNDANSNQLMKREGNDEEDLEEGKCGREK